MDDVIPRINRERYMPDEFLFQWNIIPHSRVGKVTTKKKFHSLGVTPLHPKNESGDLLSFLIISLLYILSLDLSLFVNIFDTSFVNPGEVSKEVVTLP